ncbi:serine/threonine-protein kinase [Niveomyces insectorum RCEF 264]|uniref:Serine/threonine-protein kinase n=1 Tax=Niveomyces insectorum RCEF 264 TaxID=1081102 RepID=A0A167X4J4_9HYPO|nr:serine/threonine-protein kinase [Niveomyces insectorum RCEF 264]
MSASPLLAIPTDALAPSPGSSSRPSSIQPPRSLTSPNSNGTSRIKSSSGGGGGVDGGAERAASAARTQPPTDKAHAGAQQRPHSHHHHHHHHHHRHPPDLDVAERLNEEEKNKYIRGKELGEGTYAVVYEGRLRADPSQLVAIKKIKVQKEYSDGIAPDAVREIKFLQELRHPNIVRLHGVYSTRDQNLNLVLEHLPRGDLEMLIRDTAAVRYGAADIKAWMGMLCRAVAFCHDRAVLHRDIKPNNLLVAADGALRLADFGLARACADPYRPMTANVVTRWYRPPELLFGARHYAGAVDVWSVGLVFAELVIRNPYLPGNTEVEQIALICRALGTPTEDNWPGVTRLDAYTVPSDRTYPVPGRDAFLGPFGTVGPDGVDLLMKTLVLDPRRRITARAMLAHAWWHAEPRPTPVQDLPRRNVANAEKAKKDKEREQAKMAADLKRRPGVVGDEDRGAKVARRLDFGRKG